MIDFPRKIPTDELDIRIKEWKLAGLETSWNPAGTLHILIDNPNAHIEKWVSTKYRILARYKSGPRGYDRAWRLPKKKIKELLK